MYVFTRTLVISVVVHADTYFPYRAHGQSLHVRTLLVPVGHRQFKKK